MPKKYSKSTEDYLETIYLLIDEKGYARTKDIARKLNVSPASVTEMLHKLQEKGLVLREKYSPAVLTKKGEKVAKSVKKRHDTLTRFFKLIHVPDEIAQEDACRIEHELTPETLNQLAKLVESIESPPTQNPWLKQFNQDD